MKNKIKNYSVIGGLLISVFLIWTILIQKIDVKPIGVNGTDIGFATVNIWFHSLFGVEMCLYSVTDWLGLIPVAICMIFGIIGFVQLIKRKNLFGVDKDILISGIYYCLVIFCYLIFETIPINYRPILINGFAEASYPSSTTLLVLCVMPSAVFLINRRLKNDKTKKCVSIIAVLFSAFMVIGRTISGVHWITDIIGSVLLSFGLFLIYKTAVLITDKGE